MSRQPEQACDINTGLKDITVFTGPPARAPQGPTYLQMTQNNATQQTFQATRNLLCLPFPKVATSHVTTEHPECSWHTSRTESGMVLTMDGYLVVQPCPAQPWPPSLSVIHHEEHSCTPVRELQEQFPTTQLALGWVCAGQGLQGNSVAHGAPSAMSLPNTCMWDQ